jgi:hypothetical protein
MLLLLPESMVESPKAKRAVIFGVALIGIIGRETKEAVKNIVKKMVFLEYSMVFNFYFSLITYGTKFSLILEEGKMFIGF